jgi:hypothetical protein
MSQAAATPPATLPEVAKSALSPTFSPPTRNPFSPKDVVLAKNGSQTGSPGGRRGADKPSDAARQKDGTVANPLGGLTLDATYLVGKSRLAIINGRVYGVNERLPASKLTILDVLPYKVLLECEGKVLALAYADTLSARTASTRSDAARSKSSSARKPLTSSSSSGLKGGG